MSGVDPVVVASLGAKLDALDLSDAERVVLTDLLADPDSEVSGFSFGSFGDLLGQRTSSSLTGTAGSPDVYKAPLAGAAGSPEVYKTPLMGTAGSPEV